MVRCPLCQSQRTIAALAGSRWSCLCLTCLTRWLQEGEEQKGIKPGRRLWTMRHPSRPSPSPQHRP